MFASDPLGAFLLAVRGRWLGVPQAVWLHALLVSAAKMPVAAYLASGDLSGLRTWA